jgi:hypothetical protein
MNQTTYTRRDFLKISTAGLCAVCLAACGKLPTASPQEYWQVNRKDLLDDFDSVLNPVKGLLATRCGQQQSAAILAESRKAYEALLPQVPYIGGDDNNLTETLYMSAIALAFYRTMQNHGQSIQETGFILYRAVEHLVNFNNPLAAAQTRNPNGKETQDEFRRMARWSQKSRYPGDWKLNFVEGDGSTFDFGVDYTECGLVKFYRAQKAEELAPYMCLGDFPISLAVGSGLVRTTTLARGGSRCDFRFKAGRPIQMEWTPEFLQEKG